jgi:uncharacterized membrane protein YdjX (TVP38/TMEM64 family)
MRGKAGLVVLVAVVVAATVAALVVDLPTGAELRAHVQGTGTLAPVVFVALCTVGTAAFFPKPVLATAAGLLFGVLPGIALAVVGFTMGALISFAVARKLGRRTVASWLGNGRLRVLDTVFAERGVAATFVLRLLPVLPFSVANYGAGVTAVRIRFFALGTAVGLLPPTLLAALLGDALQEPGSPRSVVTLAAWLVLSVVAVLWGRRLLLDAAPKVAARAESDPVSG